MMMPLVLSLWLVYVLCQASCLSWLLLCLQSASRCLLLQTNVQIPPWNGSLQIDTAQNLESAVQCTDGTKDKQWLQYCKHVNDTPNLGTVQKPTIVKYSTVNTAVVVYVRVKRVTVMPGYSGGRGSCPSDPAFWCCGRIWSAETALQSWGLGPSSP